MLNKKLNVKLLWMQFEDVLAPRLGLTVWDRAVYSYLLRHSLVVGKLRLHFAVLSVARDLGLSNGPVRQAVRRLDALGALRLLERSKTGPLVEMRLPEQIRALRPAKNGASQAAGEPPASTLETTDFLKTWALRKAIHDRERGACFYCLRRTPANVQCLDHVRATRTLRTQFLAQPGFLLYRMQHAQGRPSGPGFSAHSLPPGPPDARRTRRTPSRLERSRRRQAPPCGLCRGRALARLLVSSRVPPFVGAGLAPPVRAAAGMSCPPPFLRAVPARPRSSAVGAAYFSPARKRWVRGI